MTSSARRQLDGPASTGLTAGVCHGNDSGQDPRRRHTPARRPVGTTDGFWVIAESLDSESEPTVITDAVGQRRFQRMFRAFYENKRSFGPKTAEQGLALAHRTAREGRAVTAQVQVGDQQLSVGCRPVFGPSGAVHAVRIQAGTPGGIDPQVPLIPVEFDTARRVHFGRADGRTPVSALFREDVPWTLPAVLENVTWLDKRLDLIALFDPVAPAPRWCGSLLVDDPVTNCRRHLWMAARSIIGPQHVPIVRAVIADLTARVPAPDRDPLTEHLGTRTIRGHGSALMDLHTTLMHSVVCHDDPRLARWRHDNPQLHPDDLVAVMQAVVDLIAGRSVTIALRIRFTDHQPWTTLHAACSPLVNYSRPQASIDFWIEDSQP